MLHLESSGKFQLKDGLLFNWNHPFPVAKKIFGSLDPDQDLYNNDNQYFVDRELLYYRMWRTNLIIYSGRPFITLFWVQRNVNHRIKPL